jgi:hypothetical protein
MTEFGDHSPRRYFVDQAGRRVVIGLTIEETTELETHDSPSAFDEGGSHVASGENGVSATTREKRWLELYRKYDQARPEWMAETCTDRRGSLEFLTRV